MKKVEAQGAEVPSVEYLRMTRFSAQEMFVIGYAQAFTDLYRSIRDFLPDDVKMKLDDYDGKLDDVVENEGVPRAMPPLPRLKGEKELQPAGP